MIVNSVAELIGRTPLLKIPVEVHGIHGAELYAKLEYMNPFGSLKDRVALGMLEPVLESAKAKRQTILEASSGNTAKALCALAGVNGLKFKTVTNRIKTPEVRMVLQTLGAEIEELPGLSDCPDPLDPNDFTAVAARMAAAEPERYLYTDQYFNERNLAAHYQTTGREILSDLPAVTDYFCFLGTCGSAMGVGKLLKEQVPFANVWGVVAAAGHHVPGGRNSAELWEVGFFKREFFSDLIEGTRDQAIEGMLELNRRVGILCGPTTGLTYVAACRKLRELTLSRSAGEGKRIAVFIACDRLESYMSYLKNHAPDIFAAATSTRRRVEGLDPDEVGASPQLSPNALKECIGQSNFFVVDIRGNFAFSRGHIPGSINVLDELFAQMIEEGSVFPTGAKICVVCSVGTISRKYAAFLLGQGYQAASLDGGITAWKRAGHPLAQTSQIPRN